MTYCIGLCLDDGLVFGSDSRTNAGVDYVTTYSKMYVFSPSPDRVFVILSAGNLATTQEVMNHIQRDLDFPSNSPNLGSVRYLFEAAEYIGRVSLEVQTDHSAALTSSGVSGETTLLLGGQIAGQQHGLMLIYPQGNYITASPETPYLQIGESKYGKPAVDRIVSPHLTLEEGARLALVSLDGTTRSNITVGPPFEIALYQRDTLALNQRCRFEEKDPYLTQLREQWNAGIRAAFENLPHFDWVRDACPGQTQPTSLPGQSQSAPPTDQVQALQSPNGEDTIPPQPNQTMG